MKTNSIVERKSAEPRLQGPVPAAEHGLLRFPGEDDGRSLTRMAQRDLDAALQLLAQRAQYITAASGAAVALREEAGMVCRASAGSSAPGLGSHLQVDSGLSGESVRTKQILRCDNADTDARVNRETCKALGISSVIVMPLVHDDVVIGVFELFSDRVAAFEERDVVALQRISEMIMAAVEHAQAAKRTELELREPEEIQPPETAAKIESSIAVEQQTGAQQPESKTFDTVLQHRPESSAVVFHAETAKVSPPPVEKFEDDEPLFATFAIEPGKIGKCSSCGFPVSEGRSLCLDCEKRVAHPEATAEFLSNFGASDQSWFASHKYLILAVILMFVLLFSIALKFR